MNTLLFKNDTASTVHEFNVSLNQADTLCEWYGAFYSGDKYFVYLNGVKVDLDLNGMLILYDS